MEWKVIITAYQALRLAQSHSGEGEHPADPGGEACGEVDCAAIHTDKLWTFLVSCNEHNCSISVTVRRISMNVLEKK